MDMASFEKEVIPNDPTPVRVLTSDDWVNRLAGKRRIFAIGNWLNQRLFNSVHRWLMDVIRQITMGGMHGCLFCLSHSPYVATLSR